MNLRKFYLTLSSIILVFLFITGTMLLGFIGGSNSSGGIFPGSDIVKDFFAKKDPVNVLLLGGDKVNGNTDTMMLVNYNPVTAKINVLSIPRDTKVRIDGSSHKINYAYPHGGIDLTVKTVSSLLDVNINYYVYIDTKVFRDVIDELDGVDFYIPVNMDYDDPTQNLHIHLKKGQKRLYGKDAEGLMRFRHPNTYKGTEKGFKEYYDGSDLKRIDMQQKFIKEVIRQKANIMYLPKMNKIINMVFDKIETNVTLSEALKMSNNITQIKPDLVSTFKLMGEDRRTNGIWYYIYNNKIINNSTKEEFDADIILNEHFKATGGFENTVGKTGNVKPDDDEDKNTDANKNVTKKSYTKKNPSNKDTKIKPEKKPAP